MIRVEGTTPQHLTIGLGTDAVSRGHDNIYWLGFYILLSALPCQRVQVRPMLGTRLDAIRLRGASTCGLTCRDSQRYGNIRVSFRVSLTWRRLRQGSEMGDGFCWFKAAVLGESLALTPRHMPTSYRKGVTVTAHFLLRDMVLGGAINIGANAMTASLPGIELGCGSMVLLAATRRKASQRFRFEP